MSAEFDALASGDGFSSPSINALVETSRNRLEEIGRLREQVRYYRDLFWEIYKTTGADTDGDRDAPPEGVYTPDYPELALTEVKELARLYDQLCEDSQS